VANRGTDRDLDAALVAELIVEQFAYLAGLEVDHFGDGWDNEVFSVGHEWLFRFPKRSDVVPWLAREIELMPLVNEALGVLAPRFEHIGAPSARFPYPFVGYRRLPGIGADHMPAPDVAPGVGLAEELGLALSRLHQIDPNRVPRTPAGWEDEPWSEHRKDLVAVADLARSALPPSLLRRTEPYLAGQIAEPLQDGPQRFIHNDICADHVLVNPSTGRLAGLIDFNDAMVGDPVHDFVGLITIGRLTFIQEVVRRYELAVGGSFNHKLIWLARTLTLKWLADAVLADEPAIANHLTWVERAFE
jgi:aminoglycoside phosphotransferase (APT) family kinase protein